MNQQKTMTAAGSASAMPVVRIDRKTPVSAVIAHLRQLKDKQVEFAKIEIRRG
jgi:hypothetical protein